MKTFMNPTRALITGGTGFIGSHLAGRLLADGWDVHIITRCAGYGLLHEHADSYRFHIHDGSTESMDRIVAAARPEVVFHLASLFLSEHSASQLEALITSNILFATQLADAMAAHGVRLLVNTGTSWEHYGTPPVSPVNLYAATKQAFEAILRYYVEARGLRAVSLKLFDTYGPGDPRPKLFTLLRKVAANQDVLAMSLGEQLIDLVFIDDVVEAYILAAERLLADTVKGHECYAVSSGTPLELRELVELYGRVLGTPLPIEWGGRPYRQREVMVPWNTGTTVPGWHPKVALEQGIRRMEGLPAADGAN